MKIADFREAAMEWTMTIEGRDENGEVQRAQLRIEKGFDKLTSGEIGLSIDDGKRIMSTLQEFVVKQELATYALPRWVCASCERLRPVKDYTMRKIRTVFKPSKLKTRAGCFASVAFATFRCRSRFSTRFVRIRPRRN
jgi:hypothetical protein